MIIAINEENQRIHPFKNGKGKCECCNELVIAHCGEIRKYHWQHKSLKDCDSWKEPETEWHINWKNEFPMDNQEVIIEKNGQKHRADVKNDRGIVIEFQNSSIASTIIKEREEFYGEMVWVINAEKFKDNFIISSLVKRKLEELEYDFDREMYSFGYSQSSSEKKFHENISSLEREIIMFKEKQDYLFQELNQTIADKIDHSHLFNKYYQAILQNRMPDLKNSEFDIFIKIKNAFKDHIFSIKKELKNIEDSISKNNEILGSINELKILNHNDLTFREINYGDINSENYVRVTILDKILPLFPKFIKFKNLSDFESYKTKKENFTFLADFSERIDLLTKSTSNLIVDNEKLAEKESELLLSMKSKIQDLLSVKITSLKEESNSLPTKIRDLENQIIILNLEFNDDNESSFEKEREADFNKNRIDIMNRFKGQHNLNWKHPRQSWDYSRKTLFFDLGNEYLFERINSTTLKKHKKTDFIQKFS